MKKKFTLIELLVVIAIIAILAAMLLPSLGRARQMALSTQCINNLKQMATANMMYANDYGVFCPIKQTNANDEGRYIWYYGTAGTAMTGSSYNLTSGGFLHTYLGENNESTMCPVWIGQSDLKNYSEADTLGGIGYARVSFSSTISSTDTAISNGRTSPGSVGSASNLLMFGDTAMGTTPTGTGIWVAKGQGMIDKYGTTHFRHNGKANIAWCDGHVSSVGYVKDADMVLDESEVGAFCEDDRNFNPYFVESDSE